MWTNFEDTYPKLYIVLKLTPTAGMTKRDSIKGNITTIIYYKYM